MMHAKEQSIHDIMSGRRRGFLAGAARIALAALEPFYAAATVARNRLYDAQIKRSVRLPRPVISIGNITAGGTGKTPMVRWLASRLRNDGLQVAILSRGYKATTGYSNDSAKSGAEFTPSPGTPGEGWGEGPPADEREGPLPIPLPAYRARGPEMAFPAEHEGFGDEQIMLHRLLNTPGKQEILLRANPDRVASAEAVLRDRPETDLFLLDDAFQHRRVMRDLNIVLINATEPFGFGHVLPRGLLREPLSGLRRADGVVITHADEVGEEAISTIERQVRVLHPNVPTYRAKHVPVGLRSPAASPAIPTDRTIDDLRQSPFFAFCGIGDPEAFHRQVAAMGESCRGGRSFPDHHSYSVNDLLDLKSQAEAKGAHLLITTEKDWTKIAPIESAAAGLPEIWRLDVELRFESGDEQRLYDQVQSAITRGRLLTGSDGGREV